MRDRIPFRTAWQMWRSRARSITGETVTFGMLCIIALQAMWFAAFNFFTTRLLKAFWRAWRRGK